MSAEEEVVLADIEVAGRLLTDSIARDSRFASCDLQDALDAARFSSHPYSTPPKEVHHRSFSLFSVFLIAGKAYAAHGMPILAVVGCGFAWAL